LCSLIASFPHFLPPLPTILFTAQKYCYCHNKLNQQSFKRGYLLIQLIYNDGIISYHDYIPIYHPLLHPDINARPTRGWNNVQKNGNPHYRSLDKSSRKIQVPFGFEYIGQVAHKSAIPAIRDVLINSSPVSSIKQDGGCL